MAKEYFNHHATRTAIEISVELDDEIKGVGTGFFVQASKHLPEGPQIDCLLLISNKHVLVEGVGTQIIFLNKKGEDGKIAFGQQNRIEIDHSVQRYIGHKDEEIDLACLDLRGIETEEYDVPILGESFLNKLDYSRFGVGSDVLYAGYPNKMKDRKNGLALMRKGSIASVPSMDCESKGLIAIDGTVLYGNSGGPVFVDYEDSYRLLGVMHAKSSIADDYGFVIKQKYVNELIQDALDKSANELRERANTLILLALSSTPLKSELQKVSDKVWKEISIALDKKRKKGNIS